MTAYDLLSQQAQETRDILSFVEDVRFIPCPHPAGEPPTAWMVVGQTGSGLLVTLESVEAQDLRALGFELPQV